MGHNYGHVGWGQVALVVGIFVYVAAALQDTRPHHHRAGHSKTLWPTSKRHEPNHRTEVSKRAQDTAVVRHGSLLRETCSEEKFEEAVTHMKQTGALKGKTASVKEAVKARYLEYLDHDIFKRCESIDPALWPVNDKKLIINLGEGTTGTTFVDKAMRLMGFKTAHHLMQKRSTADWAEFDYISDSPVPEQAWQLVKSFPNAVFLLSVRDGAEWLKHRIIKKGGPGLHQAIPCGESESSITREADPGVNMAAYEAWVKCIIPRSKLFTFNLWNMKDEQFVEKLTAFLRKQGFSLPAELSATSGMRRLLHDLRDEHVH